MTYRDPDRWTGRPRVLRPHDPPPGYRPPKVRSRDLGWQGKLEQSRTFVRILTALLILLVVATVTLIAVMIATHG
ncbi:MAG: hypothetical protein ABSA93_21580 [Streptosporangiaceae bacterium]|jgi:hypothetical protein